MVQMELPLSHLQTTAFATKAGGVQGACQSYESYSGEASRKTQEVLKISQEKTRQNREVDEERS